MNAGGNNEQAGQQGINRYIVGCKLYQMNFCHASMSGINRYIVGCK